MMWPFVNKTRKTEEKIEEEKIEEEQRLSDKCRRELDRMHRRLDAAVQNLIEQTK